MRNHHGFRPKNSPRPPHTPAMIPCDRRSFFSLVVTLHLQSESTQERFRGRGGLGPPPDRCPKAPARWWLVTRYDSCPTARVTSSETLSPSFEGLRGTHVPSPV